MIAALLPVFIAEHAIAQTQERPVDPRAEASLAQGVALYKQGDFKGAIAAFNQSISLEPAYSLAFNNRGLVQTALKNYPQAIQDFNQAIQLNLPISMLLIIVGKRTVSREILIRRFRIFRRLWT